MTKHEEQSTKLKRHEETVSGHLDIRELPVPIQILRSNQSRNHNIDTEFDQDILVTVAPIGHNSPRIFSMDRVPLA